MLPRPVDDTISHHSGRSWFCENVHLHMYICKHIYTYLHIYIIYIYIYTYIYIYIHVYMHIYIYTYIYIYIYKYIYIYICMIMLPRPVDGWWYHFSPFRPFLVLWKCSYMYICIYIYIYIYIHIHVYTHRHAYVMQLIWSYILDKWYIFFQYLWLECSMNCYCVTDLLRTTSIYIYIYIYIIHTCIHVYRSWLAAHTQRMYMCVCTYINRYMHTYIHTHSHIYCLTAHTHYLATCAAVWRGAPWEQDTGFRSRSQLSHACIYK
jgi:hypothetical protein